jgi:hypothetical protein
MGLAQAGTCLHNLHRVCFQLCLGQLMLGQACIADENPSLALQVEAYLIWLRIFYIPGFRPWVCFYQHRAIPGLNSIEFAEEMSQMVEYEPGNE